MKKLAIPFLLLFAIFLAWCTTTTQVELLEQQNQLLQQQIEQQQKQLEQKQTTETNYNTNTYQAPTPEPTTTTTTYTPPVVKTETTNCNIKWNISYNWWEKIYHVPWCTSYNATVIDTSKGERRFCTESEARAAWWRKAYNCP